jgi:FtsH-binding integral membrane protein
MTALLLFVITNGILEKDQSNVFKIGERLLPLFILVILILFGLFAVPQKNQGLRHLLWLGLIILMSVSGHPIYTLAKENNILNKVLITLGILFISMSYLAYSNRLGFFDGVSPYLFTGLIGLVIFEALDLLFADYNSPGIYNRFWYYSIFGIVLFSGFLIYDTQQIISDGHILEAICKNQNHLVCADYPIKSLSIFLDILNLFNKLTYVYSRN